MKVLLLANTDWFLYRFNSELMSTLQKTGAEVVVASPDGPYVKDFVAAGYRWQRMDMERRRLNPLLELRTLWQLAKLLRHEKPDLVHSFTLKCALYGAAMARLTRVPAIVSSITGLGYLYSHTRPTLRLLRGCLEQLAKAVLPGTHVIFLNRDDLEQFRHRLLVTREQSHLIRSSGVDTQQFRPQSLLPQSDRSEAPHKAGKDNHGASQAASPPLVVLPARLLWSKGVGDFVDASRLLQEEGVAVRMVLVGVGDENNPDGIPQTHIAGWEKLNLVETWGFREDMINVYHQAAIVCLPTFYREGVPTVLLEAAACGLPVVTTDMPGCREAVEDGVTGLLVPPRNPDALAQALGRLLSDGDLRRVMGAAGRRRVEEQLSTTQVVLETLQVYDRAGLSLTQESRP